MRRVSVVEVPNRLKNRIEQAARERGQDSPTLIANALDLLLEVEEIQAAEARRRASSPTGKSIPNEHVMAWLETWGQIKRS
jgi:predicted transcriptional regulator